MVLQQHKPQVEGEEHSTCAQAQAMSGARPCAADVEEGFNLQQEISKREGGSWEGGGNAQQEHEQEQESGKRRQESISSPAASTIAFVHPSASTLHQHFNGGGRGQSSAAPREGCVQQQRRRQQQAQPKLTNYLNTEPGRERFRQSLPGTALWVADGGGGGGNKELFNPNTQFWDNQSNDPGGVRATLITGTVAECGQGEVMMPGWARGHLGKTCRESTPQVYTVYFLSITPQVREKEHGLHHPQMSPVLPKADMEKRAVDT